MAKKKTKKKPAKAKVKKEEKVEKVEKTTEEAPPAYSSTEGIPSDIRSLRDLMDRVTGKHLADMSYDGDSGLAELWPFPFLAMVGQKEMKLGLLLALINPFIGGVLLVGPRGTGKTTAVRSLIDIMPSVGISTCYYGCTEDDIEIGGIDAVCPHCAVKYGHGEPLTEIRPVKLVELPLNSRLDDVIGSVDERAAQNNRMRVKRGILSYADQNLLYIDEVNLLSDQVIDAILDAAAQGSFTVRRGAVFATYRSRFILVGTMNPEEGMLRPQIMDRFGLRLIVRGLDDTDERLRAYNLVKSYKRNPRLLADWYAEETMLARDEVDAARQLLKEVKLPEDVAKVGLELVDQFEIESLRAEITLFEGARALAAADGRKKVIVDDIRQVGPLALRLRRSEFMEKYFEKQDDEDQEIQEALDKLPSS